MKKKKKKKRREVTVIENGAAHLYKRGAMKLTETRATIRMVGEVKEVTVGVRNGMCVAGTAGTAGMSDWSARQGCLPVFGCKYFEKIFQRITFCDQATQATTSPPTLSFFIPDDYC